MGQRVTGAGAGLAPGGGRGLDAARCRAGEGLTISKPLHKVLSRPNPDTVRQWRRAHET